MLSVSVKSRLHRARGVCDFTSVTEQPGLATTREGLSMLYSRYSLAADLSEGKEVLEIACGAGMGLGLLARRAKRLIAGDFSEPLLLRARSHYSNRVGLVRLDAHSLPFAHSSFDAVLCFEAIYYLHDPRRFLRECRRVLRPQGFLLICAANPECPGFNRSPHSFRYFRAEELRLILLESRFRSAIYGGFATSANSFRDKSVAAIRSKAAHFHLFPRSLKGKEFLKRLFYGRLVRIQEELSVDSTLSNMPQIVGNTTTQPVYKVLYAIARPC